ncbi:MAG: type II secretion system F family protein [Rhodobacteraceae bacterium]|nr:type II secretion system F family protein [Paracoccaceae bacterium]
MVPLPLLFGAGFFVLLVATLLIATTASDAAKRRRRLAQAAGQRVAGPREEPHFLRGFRRFAVTTAERFAVLNGAEARKSTTLLVAAGFRSRDAVLVYSFLKLILPVALLAFGLIWGLATGDLFHHPAPGAILILGSALAVSKVPDAVLAAMRKKRSDAIRRAFPDMLELLVITSESGLSPAAAMRRVAYELDDESSILGAELRQFVVELSLIADRQVAYRNFEERVPIAEVSLFVNTLDQADRFGTSFATAMRTLMADMRAHLLLRTEERAARIPATMTVPLIFFIMPALFVILIGPAALSIMDNIMNR